jgi:WD40 repeat protein
MTSPFKFLDSYTKDDRRIFFGREREIEELYHRIFESKIMLVYGVSGTGKSSLIHCGLANKFQETDWLPIVVRRGGNIIESMAAGIEAASITVRQKKLLSPSDFLKGVRSLYLDHYKPVFFIFDQFEELFIFGDKEERRAFIHIVKTLTESDIQCRMIFVMREEYMAGVTEFEKFIPTFFSNRVRIEKMSYRNALTTIKEPCRVFNISLEEGFAETLLEKLSPGSEEVELTYLQVFLDKVFKLAVNESGTKKDIETLSFSISLLNKIGNVTDLLGSFLDDQISLMDNPEIALMILKSMVSIQGTKRQLTADEIGENVQSFGKHIDKTPLHEMLRKFINIRILREKDENGRMELRHDALAAKVYEKFTMAEKELLEVRKYIENAFYNFQSRGIFLSKDDLDYLADYEDKLIVPIILSDFIKKSKEKIYERRKALKKITRISTLVLLLILTATLRFYISTKNSENADNLFRSSLMLSATDPVKGLIAELDLWQKDSTSGQLHSFILKNFQRILQLKADTTDRVLIIQKLLMPVKLKSAIVNAKLSQTEVFIVGWMEDQNIFVFDISTKKLCYFRAEGEIKHIEISEKDSLLAIVYCNNRVSVNDLKGRKLHDFMTTQNEVNNDKLVCFSPSENNLFALVKDSLIYLYNTSGSIIAELNGHSGKLNSVDFSPDGQYIVSAGNDHCGYIWNYNHKTGKYFIYNKLIGHHDKIWSCRFNKTGKYIITASADSTIKIWDLNGTHINSEFNFIVYQTRSRLNRGEKDEDASNPYFARYYGKFCDACFSRQELEIIATGYKPFLDTTGKMKSDYYKVLFFDGVGGFPYGYNRSYFIGSPTGEAIKNIPFSEFVLSPDDKIAAAVDSTNSRIYLITGTNYILMSLKGRNPMFTNDSDELYWISDDKIFITPISVQKIKKLTEPLRSSAISRETNFVVI